MEKQISLTDQEANALIQIIDIAIKSGGLSVAGAALHINNKIQKAFADEPEVLSDNQKEGADTKPKK